ncbi:MAG: heme A synthase, partial [Merismopedia sp. SIO2A8]|nr:heme A synthase [Merismopedia sp. SIO2A8]
AWASYQIRQLLWKLVMATFILMGIGSATRVMNAGLACPDWPLCYGTLIPAQQMNLQVFLEWIHRLDASLIGVMTIALVALSVWKRRSLPKWVPWASGFALFLVCAQGALGAFTVTQLLRFDIVTAHLGTALFFFIVLLTMAMALIPPTAGPDPIQQPLADSSPFPKRMAWLALGVALIIYGQSLTGGLVGSRWALHQCLAIAQLCSVMNSHLIGVIPSTVGVLAIAGWGWRHRRTHDQLVVGFSQLAGGLLVIQLLLGLATFRLHLQVELLTIAHQTTGAALLGSLVCAAVRGFNCHRDWVQSIQS